MAAMITLPVIITLTHILVLAVVFAGTTIRSTIISFEIVVKELVNLGDPKIYEFYANLHFKTFEMLLIVLQYFEP